MRPVLSVPPPLPVSRIGSWSAPCASPSNRLDAHIRIELSSSVVSPSEISFIRCGEVGELRDVELVRLQVHRFLVGGLPVVREVEVQRALHALEELEVHLRQVVVEHQRRDARLVHLEREHDQVEHQLHVIRARSAAARSSGAACRAARASAASLRCRSSFDARSIRFSMSRIDSKYSLSLCVVAPADLRPAGSATPAAPRRGCCGRARGRCRRRPGDRTRATG